MMIAIPYLLHNTMPGSTAAAPVLSPPQSAQGSRVGQARIENAAHEFEASLLEQLMPAISGSGPEAWLADDVPGGEGAGSTDALASFAREAMARALSAHGGFGIADSVMRYFGTAEKAK